MVNISMIYDETLIHTSRPTVKNIDEIAQIRILSSVLASTSPSDYNRVFFMGDPQ